MRFPLLDLVRLSDLRDFVDEELFAVLFMVLVILLFLLVFLAERVEVLADLAAEREVEALAGFVLRLR